MLTIDKVFSAKNVLKKVVRKTDLMPAMGLSSDNNVYLKPENLQKTGSFKIRGSYYKISQLSEEEKAKGIIASSAGNHAQGVALAAQQENIPCVICMPDNAPISKIEATKGYGAKVCLAEGAYDEAYALALLAKAAELNKPKKLMVLANVDDKKETDLYSAAGFDWVDGTSSVLAQIKK